MNSLAFAPESVNDEAKPARKEIDPRPAPREPQAARASSEEGSPAARQGSASPARPAAAETSPATATLPNKLPAVKRDRSFTVVMVSTTLSVLVALVVGRSGWFTPGDNVGYYIGLVGGVMMLLLLLYPLRKYVAAFRNWGKVKYWFAVHMVLGICGPILVLAHSTFHMRSTNAAVALICMLVVAGSGIVGRFLYTKVHRGLYGEKLNLKELQGEAGIESAEIRSRLHFAPAVEKRLLEFQEYALAPREGFVGDAARFLTLGFHRLRVQHASLRDLRSAMRTVAEARGWDAEKYRRRVGAASGIVKAYLGAAQRVAEFSVYDRLLQLWHVAHVPLVYLLVISAIAHVVAVHMY
jgi:hypothetical protein